MRCPLDAKERLSERVAHWDPYCPEPTSMCCPLGAKERLSERAAHYVSGTPINTDETTAASAAFYCEIWHPTIDAVVQMILKFCTRAKEKDPTVQWSDLRL